MGSRLPTLYLVVWDVVRIRTFEICRGYPSWGRKHATRLPIGLPLRQHNCSSKNRRGASPALTVFDGRVQENDRREARINTDVRRTLFMGVRWAWRAVLQGRVCDTAGTDERLSPSGSAIDQRRGGVIAAQAGIEAGK